MDIVDGDAAVGAVNDDGEAEAAAAEIDSDLADGDEDQDYPIDLYYAADDDFLGDWGEEAAPVPLQPLLPLPAPEPDVAQVFEDPNPLLFPEILKNIFGYLHPRDLTTCYDVCQAWRQETPSRGWPARQTQSPITVCGDMSDPDGVAYLAALQEGPNSKASKFIFENVALKCTAVQTLLRENGAQMKELEFRRSSSFTSRRFRDPTCYTSSSSLFDLLKDKVPCLTTLILGDLPPDALKPSQYPDDITRTSDYPSDLALRKIEITLPLNIHDQYDEYQHQEYRHRDRGRPGAAFFIDLFTICPHLEDVTVVAVRANNDTDASDGVLKIIESLALTSRLPQIQNLMINGADDRVLKVLSEMDASQLKFLLLTDSSNKYPGFIVRILNRQRTTLEHVDVPINYLRHALPQMPNLTGLIFSQPKPSRHFPFPQHNHNQLPNVDVAPRIINYPVQFPNLLVLGFKGVLERYVVDEIFPVNVEPCTSVKALEDMPIGVNRQIMTRIGHLFPNLNSIRAVIPYKHEHLLISIWESCPNITNLSLTLCEDTDRYKTPEAQLRESLDSLFSGIPESECRRLRELPAEERERQLTTLDLNTLRDGMPSICNLHHLTDLHLSFNCEYRRDKLSNIFGYSTLAALSDKFRFFEINKDLVKIPQPCVDHICDQMGMNFVSERNSLIHRLIKRDH